MTTAFLLSRLCRILLPAVLGTAVLLGPSAPVAATSEPAAQARSVMTGFLLPSTAVFTDTAEKAQAAIDVLCAQDRAADPEALAGARDAFAEVLGAWSRLAFLRFGPLQEENRYERLYFWPDPRGLVVRQMRPLLAEGADGLTGKDVATHSVAVQGLPALELVLFGASGDSGVPGASACRHARAVAANVVEIAAAVRQEWQPDGSFGKRFMEPGDHNPYYRNAAERNNEIVKALAGGLQFIDMAELSPMLQAGDRVTPRRAPFWRSGLTFLHVKQHLQGVVDFYRASGFSPSSSQQWAQDAWLAEMQRAIGLSEELAAQTPRQWEAGRIALLRMMIANAREILVQDVAPGLGVSIGFNALDGD